MTRQLQLTVTRLERWSRDNGLRFSTTKTVAMHFCRRRCADPTMGIRLYGQTIPTYSVAKFLGVIFDRHLTYREHFRTLRERCFKSLNVLKCVARTSYGADRRTLLLLYRSIVRSKLDYACFVYDSASESSKKVLDAVHHAALRIVTGAFRTSPKCSLLAEANEPPLALRREMLGMRYTLKLRQFPTHPTYPYVFSRHATRSDGRMRPSFGIRMKNLFSDAEISFRGVRRTWDTPSPPWGNANPEVDLSLSLVKKDNLLPAEARARALEHIASYDGYIRVFTDGSKTSEGVACSFVAGCETRSFSLPSSASVFSSELVAIEKALCFIEVSDGLFYLILSDSLSSLLALRSFNPVDPIVQDILTRLKSVERSGKSICFSWIPSHVGIHGNELADASARRAAAAPCTRRLPLPARDYYPLVRPYIMSKWQTEWDLCAASKLRGIKPTLEPWQSCLQGNRFQEVVLCRLRIGHTYATHSYLISGGEQPTCSRCSVPLTVAHILLQCPRLEPYRTRHLGRIASNTTIRHLLGDESPHVSSGNIFSFIQSIRFPVIYSSY